MKTINFIIVVLILALCIIVIGITLSFKNKRETEQEAIEDEDQKTFQKLKEAVNNRVNEMCNMNLMDLSLSYEETKKRKALKSRLKVALRTCTSGDRGKKAFVKDYIKDVLVKEFKINETNIEYFMEFSVPERLSVIDKFDMLLWCYEKKYQEDAVDHLFEDFKWYIPKQDENGEYYEITSEDVEKAFYQANLKFDFLDKLECLCQKIYAYTKGNSVVDRIRDLNIDGISGGMGGIPEKIYNFNDEIRMTKMKKIKNRSRAYDYISCMYHGKTIHISALTFGSQHELERVVKNIYRYGACGHLSQDKGYIINDVADGSRVVVGRPNYADSWGFLVRKLNNVKAKTVQELLTHKGKEKAVEILYEIVRGFNVIVITGDQGSGKTTLLKGLVGLLKRTTNIRSQELIFELGLRSIYPDWNIWCFRETDKISAQDGINMAKKTDCEVEILGEVAEAKVASLAIQLSQTGTKMTMSTAHPNTTDSMIDYFADSLVITGACSDQYIAERKVCNAINFDIHMTMRDGERYIERITEVIPYEYEDAGDNMKKLWLNILKIYSRQRSYQIRNILEFENGEYVVKNKFSERTEQKILRYLNKEDRERYTEFWKDYSNNEKEEVS